MEKFTRAKPQMYSPAQYSRDAKSASTIFIIDDSWHAHVTEMVGVDGGNPCYTQIDKLTRIEDPAGQPFFVVALVVGRGRRNRYVVSNGEVYADIHGTIIPGHRTHRRQWCEQKSPWVIVKTGQKKLNQSAKQVIQAAIRAFLKVAFKTFETAPVRVRQAAV